MNNLTENNWSDKQLVASILGGDKQAFGRVIKNTEGLVAQIVFQMVKNIEDRKDIAQDIYLKTFKNLSGFKFQSKLSTWIGQIAYNTCLNYLDKKKLVLPDNFNQEKGEDDDSFDRTAMQSGGIFQNETENLVFQKELSGILKIEIQELPPVYKTLIILYHQEELSYEEIAQVTQLPQGTIKSYLFRARKTLKEKLLFKYKKEEL